MATPCGLHGQHRGALATLGQHPSHHGCLPPLHRLSDSTNDTLQPFLLICRNYSSGAPSPFFPQILAMSACSRSISHGPKPPLGLCPVRRRRRPAPVPPALAVPPRSLAGALRDLGGQRVRDGAEQRPRWTRAWCAVVRWIPPTHLRGPRRRERGLLHACQVCVLEDLESVLRHENQVCVKDESAVSVTRCRQLSATVGGGVSLRWFPWAAAG